MKLHCPDCGVAIPAADVNVQAMAAKCERCDGVFSFADAVRAEGTGRRRPPVAAVDVPRPPQVRTTVGADGRWSATWTATGAQRTAAGMLIVVPTAVIGLQLWLWLGASWTSADEQLAATVVLPFLLVPAALALGTVLIAIGVNRSTVTVSTATVVVRRGPIPWSSQRRLATGSVRRVYCDYRNPAVDPDDASDVAGAWPVRLNAVLADGSRCLLLGAQSDADVLRFVHQQLQRRLSRGTATA